MGLFARSFESLMADDLDVLSKNTKITRLGPGGIARSLLEAVNRRLAEAYDSFDLNLARAFVSNSTGQYLDLIGVLLGVTRGSSVVASATADTQVIKFYVDSGTFGDINSGSNITIPQNSILSTLATSGGVLYRTTEQATLLANANTGWISAEAIIPGEDSNVGTGSLTFHVVTSYTDYQQNTLKCINIYPIANGSNFESDANFRYRIVNTVLAGEAANQTALRLAILSTSGVADVVMVSRYRGIGTFGAILKAITPTVSQSLIDDVTANVSDIMAYGDIAYIRAPIESGLTMKITVHYDMVLSEDDLTTIEATIISSITDFVNNLDIGQTFLSNRMIGELFSVSDHITNFGETGKPIDEMYIYNTSTLEDNRVRQTLIGDYTPADDERVIIETTVTNPIVLVRDFTRRK
jgi:hypothetical protein